MISARTKLQLLVFVVITVVGVAYVGARYARLDRFLFDDTYTVSVHLDTSGGIFAGGEVTYRGVQVGRIGELELRPGGGVTAHLDIERRWDRIPADTLALVGNRSAVGEQYVELQPRAEGAPFLAEGSEVAVEDTATPLPTEKLLADISTTVESVDKEALRTTIGSLGTAFQGTGPALGRILDTSSSFLETADANFQLTRDLIRDSETVLRTQVDSGSSLRTFARDMGLFVATLADANPDLVSVIEQGGATAMQVRTFLEENQVPITELLSRLITTGEIVSHHLDEVEIILTVYPYVVEGGMTVVAKSPDTGLYDAHFGLILSTTHPCREGYEGTRTRIPQNGETWPMNEDARCTASPSEANPRGAQNAPPPSGAHARRAAPGFDAPVLGSFDPASGQLRWGHVPSAAETSRTSAPATTAPSGEEAWQWLFLQPYRQTAP